MTIHVRWPAGPEADDFSLYQSLSRFIGNKEKKEQGLLHLF
jgi:hypothetical protein